MIAFIAWLFCLLVAPAPSAEAPARPAAPAHAVSPAPSAEPLLLSGATPAEVRAHLAAFAASVENPRREAEAIYFEGMSYERAAMADSAIACYRRADARAKFPTAHRALEQALLRRRSPGDLKAAIAMLEQDQKQSDEEGLEGLRNDPSLLGWAYILAGEPKRGMAILKPLQAKLAGDPIWRYRFARGYFDTALYGEALPLLLDLAQDSREQDREVVHMLAVIEKRMGPNSHLHDRVTQMLHHHDDQEREALEALHARRVRLRAEDGTLIGGALFADSTGAPQRAAVVLAAIGDDLTAYDSLTTALRHAGFATLVLDPRGSGWSVQPDVALPDTWEGRQEPLERLVAADVSTAIGALGRLMRVDTTACVGIGVGSMAPVMIAAAANDSRIAALALLDPLTAPVDRGPTLARYRAAQVPTYLQMGLRGRFEKTFADTLSRAGAPQSLRIATSTTQGFGAGEFGALGVTPAFVRWLDEVVPPHGGRHPARRSTPRAG